MSDSGNSNEDRMAEHLEQVHQRIIENSQYKQDLPPSAWNINSGNFQSGESGNSKVETESSKPADVELCEAEGLLRLIAMVRHHWTTENDPAFNSGRANETRIANDFSTAGDHDSPEWSRDDSLPHSQAITDQGIKPKDFFDSMPKAIGRFQILEKVGYGGFGIVLRAFDPLLQRSVAIKIPHLATMLSATGQRRLLTEAQAAAALSHPKIVTLYESGQLGPICYLANQWIEGPTLAQWLDEHPEPISAEIAAGIAVHLTDALQHAHDRGVIHRDIKPANIFLASQQTDISPADLPEIVRLGDFGLAKREAGLDSVPQFETQSGAMVGTPSCMAPEQTRAADNISSATDIWAVGVLLYQLVTGRQPFIGETLVETVSNIQNVDPIPPRRIVDCPLDLEAVIQHCLEKNPARRYQSSFELQTDLQNYLAGRTVSVRSIGRAEALRRWANRNRGLATAGSVAAAAVCLALIASLTGWWFTASALNKEQLARLAEERANERTRAALAKAESQYLANRETVTSFFNVVCDDPKFIRLPQSESIRKSLLDLALTDLQNFANENQNDQDLKSELALTHLQIAEIFAQLGEPTKALENFSKSEEYLQATENPTSNTSEPSSQLSLRLHNGQAKTLMRLGEPETAAEEWKKTLDLLTGAFAETDQEADYFRFHLDALDGLANLQLNQGKTEESVQQFQKAITFAEHYRELFPTNRELRLRQANLMLRINQPLRELGHSESLRENVNSCKQLLEELIDEDPAMWDAVQSYVMLCNQAAILASQSNELQQAISLLEGSIEHVKRLRVVHPDRIDIMTMEGGIHEKLGIFQDQLGQRGKASDHLQQAISIARQQFASHPESIPIQTNLASVLMNFASFQGRSHSPPEGYEEQYREALELWSDLAKKVPDNMMFKSAIAFCHSNIGAAHEKAGQYELAIKTAEPAIERCQSLLEKQPENRQLRLLMFQAHLVVAYSYQNQQQYQEALETLNSVRKWVPDFQVDQWQVEMVYSLVGAGQFPQAEAEIELHPTLASGSTLGLDSKFKLASTYAQLQAHREAMGDDESAQKYFDQTVEWLLACHSSKGFRDSKCESDWLSNPQWLPFRSHPKMVALTDQEKQ